MLVTLIIRLVGSAKELSTQVVALSEHRPSLARTVEGGKGNAMNTITIGVPTAFIRMKTTLHHSPLLLFLYLYITESLLVWQLVVLPPCIPMTCRWLDPVELLDSRGRLDCTV